MNGCHSSEDQWCHLAGKFVLCLGEVEFVDSLCRSGRTGVGVAVNCLIPYSVVWITSCHSVLLGLVSGLVLSALWNYNRIELKRLAFLTRY